MTVLGLLDQTAAANPHFLKIIYRRDHARTKVPSTIGQTVKIGYFSQESTEYGSLSARHRLCQRSVASYVQTADGNDHALQQMLEQFPLSQNDQQYTKIAKLSGGENIETTVSAPHY